MCEDAGRLMHHLKEIEGMGLRSIEHCVFDHMDEYVWGCRSADAPPEGDRRHEPAQHRVLRV
jgi:hypothetical protein